MLEGIFDKINRMQKSIDYLTELVINIGNTMQDNFDAAQKKYDDKIELIKQELRSEIMKLNKQ